MQKSFKMKKQIFTFVLSGTLLLSCYSAYSETGEAGGAGSFLRIGVGARPLGMGGTFTAIANDVYATYWNPAGLVQLKTLQIGSMYTVMSLDRKFNYLSFAVPVNESLSFGLSLLDYRVDGIEIRDGSEIFLGTFKNSEDVLTFSIGIGLTKWFYIGGNLKYFFQKLLNDSATGYGFDAGALLKLSRFISIGFVVQDIDSSIRWDTASDREDRFPMHIRGGIALKFWSDRLLISTDVASTESGNQFNSRILHAGVEIWPTGFMAMRGGYDESDFTWGGTLKLSNFQMDYGLAKDRIDLGETHRFSFLISF